MKYRRHLVFPVLFFLGFLFRAWIAFTLTGSKVYWDMEAYTDMAHTILAGRFAANCCNHGVGYPLFLALMYQLFGIDNIVAVKLMQIVIDLASSVLIYLATKHFFGIRAAGIAFVLFIINPFTSSYTGLVLGEILLVFCVSASTYLLSRRGISSSWISWIILGMIMGFMVQIKAAYYFVIPFVALTISYVISKRAHYVSYLGLFLAGFLLISSYALLSNYAVYKKISIIPPYRTTGGLLYASFSVGRYPELAREYTTPGINDEWRSVTDEYYDYVNNKPTQLYQYDRKYTKKFYDRLTREWPIFILNTIRNIGIMWDKRFLLYYIDPYYPFDTSILRVFNATILFAWGYGLVSFIRKYRWISFMQPIVVFSLTYFLGLSIILGMVINESRLTIPYYPILMMWAGYGIHIALTLFGMFRSGEKP